ncbi:hypothetical protein HY498_04580 [Candidatus Woesearchaeota archaeon]|nr:hypothetical protein [Candidatus Woesearchaeota archaeon]
MNKEENQEHECCKQKSDKGNNVQINISKRTGVSIVVVLVAILVFSVYWISKPKDVEITGAAAGPYQGFNSYEEMMEAHHGKDAGQGVGGCDQEAALSHDLPVIGTGDKSEYGVTYDQAGYNQLMGYAQSIQLNSEQTKNIVGLNVEIPCCGFRTLQAKDNCECGHHIALYGLAKLLSSKNYSREQIQSEIDKWKSVFFPNGQGNTGGC